MVTDSMNGIPRDYTLSLTQTAKGLFYVDKLVVSANSEEDLLKKIDSLVHEVKERLNQLNIQEGI